MLNTINECLLKSRERLRLNTFEIHLPAETYDRVLENIFDTEGKSIAEVFKNDTTKLSTMTLYNCLVKRTKDKYCYIIGIRETPGQGTMTTVERKVGCLFTLDKGEV